MAQNEEPRSNGNCSGEQGTIDFKVDAKEIAKAIRPRDPNAIHTLDPEKDRRVLVTKREVRQLECINIAIIIVGLLTIALQLIRIAIG